MAKFFATWYPYLSLLAIIALFVWVSMLSQQVAQLQSRATGIRTRQELEEAYTAGRIDRDTYEKLKTRVS